MDAALYGHVIYLLHAEPALGRVRHYIGSTKKEKFDERMAAHVRGHGASLTRRMGGADCNLYLARIWYSSDRKFERGLKQRGHARRYCPFCRGERLANPIESLTVRWRTKGPKTDWKPLEFL